MIKITQKIIVSVLVFSCNTKHMENSHESISRKLEKNIFAFSVMDSLEKYSNKDSISIYFKAKQPFMIEDTTSKINEEGNYSLVEKIDTIPALLFIGKANKLDFGLMLKGANLNLYQKLNHQWTRTDSLDFFEPPVLIKKMDLNGDGYQDIRIASSYNESGDLLTCVFIFDPNANTFKHYDGFEQDNVEYDNENKFVRSWLTGTEGQNPIKWKSSIQGKRLFVDSTVAYVLPKNSKFAKLEFYKYGNSVSNPPVKMIQGDQDSLWTIFSKTFWDSSDKIRRKKIVAANKALTNNSRVKKPAAQWTVEHGCFV